MTFTYSTYINTTPEKLGGALTKAEFTRQYWGGRTVESDWKQGSTIKMIQPQGDKVYDFEGKVLKSDPPKLLSYTGIGRVDNEDTVVTFELVQMGASQVRLNITHEGLDEKMKKITSVGWYAILSSLKTLLETGEPLDFSWCKG